MRSLIKCFTINVSDWTCIVQKIERYKNYAVTFKKFVAYIFRWNFSLFCLFSALSLSVFPFDTIFLFSDLSEITWLLTRFCTCFANDNTTSWKDAVFCKKNTNKIVLVNTSNSLYFLCTHRAHPDCYLFHFPLHHKQY